MNVTVDWAYRSGLLTGFLWGVLVSIWIGRWYNKVSKVKI